MEFTYQNDYGVDYWLERANTIADMMEECFGSDEDYNLLDDFQSMFEAQETKASNSPQKETMKKGFVESIKNALQAIARKLKETFDSIKRFFKEKFASADAKRQIKELQEQVDANPELRGYKVTIDDIEKIDKLYGTAEKDAYKALQKAIKSNQDTKTFNETLSKIEDMVHKALPTAVKGITLAAAATAAAGFLAILNTAMDGMVEKGNEITEEISKVGSEGANVAQLKTIFHKFTGKWKGEKAKKTSSGFLKFMGNCFKAPFKKSARYHAAAQVVGSDGKAARVARKAAAAGLNIKGDMEARKEDRAKAAKKYGKQQAKREEQARKDYYRSINKNRK